MSLEKDQSFRSTGTGGDKVSHVSRERRKAKSRVGREEFSKPWAERKIESSRDKREGDRKKKRRDWRCSYDATFLVSTPKWSAGKVLLSGKEMY